MGSKSVLGWHMQSAQVLQALSTFLHNEAIDLTNKNSINNNLHFILLHHPHEISTSPFQRCGRPPRAERNSFGAGRPPRIKARLRDFAQSKGQEEWEGKVALVHRKQKANFHACLWVLFQRYPPYLLSSIRNSSFLSLFHFFSSFFSSFFFFPFFFLFLSCSSCTVT